MLGNMHTSSGGRRFMNRRTLYGSAYLLVSTGLLTAGFTSYAAAPDLTGQAACVQQAEAACQPGELPRQISREIAQEISREVCTEADVRSAKLLTQAMETVEEKSSQAVKEAETLGIKKEQERRAALEAAHQQELELLASIIFCEAGNQPYVGQVAVGAVVMNRVESGLFPDSIEEVVYQSGQFVPAGTGWLDQVRNAGSYTDAAMQAAKDAFAGTDPVEGCLYFDQGGYGMQIGAHYFH